MPITKGWTFMRQHIASAALILLVAWTTACGGSSAGSTASRASYGGMEEGGGYASPSPVMESYAAADESDGVEYEVSDYAAAEPPSAPMGAPAQRMMAQASPVAAPQPNLPGPAAQPPADANATATDAVQPGPLLIYQAQLHLAVFKVAENLKAVAKAGTDVGGFLSQQTDTMLVIRVPAAKFTEVIEAIEALGDVLHRQVQATDVSEEFRDVEIRIRNAMQVRERLAALLTKATTVEDSLRIERELERITGELERLKGRIRFLQDRIGYSTITVNFQPKEQEQIARDSFRLPFDWLDSLGLQRLLSL